MIQQTVTQWMKHRESIKLNFILQTALNNTDLDVNDDTDNDDKDATSSITIYSNEMHIQLQDHIALALSLLQLAVKSTFYACEQNYLRYK